jgi:hypothetical protein
MKRRASILRLARKAFGKDPRNIYVNVPVYPPADGTGVVRPNADTLHSTAWRDLTPKPLIGSAPDADGRY